MLLNPPSNTFSGDELCQLEAHQIVDLLRKGEISPEELIQASLSRIEAVEPAVNAMPQLCPEHAREILANWKQKNTDKNDPAWLGGLPIGIKDLNEVAGVITTFGSMGMKDYVPEKSDPLVSLLEDRGGLVIGKTNTPEMGAGGNTFNDVYGYTRNPWNTEMNAGGSSGGAAVSLATGEVWLSQGSDLAGSLRTPAAYCGVVGLRPSPGRAGHAPAELNFNTEAVQGPMARSVTDCALFLDAMSCFDPSSPISFPPPAESFRKTVERANITVTIAYSSDLRGFAPVAKEVDQILRQALKATEANGASVDEDCPELPEMNHCYRVLRAMLWAAGPGKAPESIQSHFKYTLMDNIDYGRKLDIEDVYKMQRSRAIIYKNMYAFLQKYDVLACPTVGLLPGPVLEEFPTELDGKPLNDYIEWLKFSYLSTVSSLPSVSIPVGFSESGMPVGLQLIGPPRGEAKLLTAARMVELAVGGPLKPIDPISPNEL